MDQLIRAMAANGQIRAFAAVTKDMVEAARIAQGTSPVATAALGRLLTAGVMMGSMLKGDKDLVTLKIRGDGPIGGILVTADSRGGAKGCVNHPQVLIHANEKGKLDVSGAIGRGTLQVIRDMGLKEPYQGTIDLQTGEIAEDLTAYFAVSEQVPSAVGLGVLMEKNNTVRQAGGFILQLMPYTSDEVVSALEEKLSGVESVTAMLEEGMTPEDILERLLGDLGMEINETRSVAFRCDCSRERVEGALISVGRGELRSMIDEGKNVEVSCQFCGKGYTFTPQELTALLAKAVR